MNLMLSLKARYTGSLSLV